MDTPPTLPQPAKSGSKKWIFIGCGGCLGLILLGCIGMAVVVFGVFAAVKSSDAYKTAFAVAANSPEVKMALGTPITDSYFVTGSVNMTDNTGKADLDTTIKGPKGTGALHYKATRSGSVWQVIEHTVTIPATGKVINLQGGAAIPEKLKQEPEKLKEADATPQSAAPTSENFKDAADAIKKALGEPRTEK